MKKSFMIQGMTCNSCAQKIEDALKDKVKNISINFAKETAEIEFYPEKISAKEIEQIIKNEGYGVENKKNKEINKKNIIAWIIFGISVLLLLFILYKITG